METKVWAFRVGNFVQDSSSGWTYSVRFNGLKDLAASLGGKKLAGQIDTLVIVAHGDSGGLVQLDRNPTHKTVASFGVELKELAAFLKPCAKLIFVSCIAALGVEGDELLTGISRYLSNRHIVGFTINGAMAQEGLPSKPGQVLEAENFQRGMAASLLKNLPMLTEYSYYSKWARNGYITKIPIGEQIKQPKYRCAWSLCPGHEHAWHRCVPAIKGVSNPRPYPG